jgi:hypothetical protein
LYSWKIDQALPELKTSENIQTVPAAKGDEECHQAAGLMEEGKYSEAQQYVDSGMNLIQSNDGSKIWLAFCYMTQASIYSKQNEPDKATETLQTALTMAKENVLTVREEELTYLTSLDPAKVDVLQAVGAKIVQK